MNQKAFLERSRGRHFLGFIRSGYRSGSRMTFSSAIAPALFLGMRSNNFVYLEICGPFPVL